MKQNQEQNFQSLSTPPFMQAHASVGKFNAHQRAELTHTHTHTHTHIHTTLASATPSPPPGLLSQRQRSSNQILGSLTLHAGAMAAFIDIENISSTQKN